MIKFEPKYVHCFWNDELEGKKGFVDDTMGGLKHIVESNNKDWFGEICKNLNDNQISYPFGLEDKSGDKDYYQLCYYDPLYEMKVAYEEGKTIQFKNYQYSEEGVWEDANVPQWCEDTEYRIKPNDEYEIVIIYGLGLRIIQSTVSPEFRKILFKGTEKECKEWVKDNYHISIVIDGYFENEPIVYKEKGVINDPWKETKDVPYDWDFDHYEYRINRAEESSSWDFVIHSKSKEYVPFENTQELIEAWEKKYPTNKDRPNGTMPLIWIMPKDNKRNVSLIIEFGNLGVATSLNVITFEILFEKWLFADGSVCGKKK